MHSCRLLYPSGISEGRSPRWLPVGDGLADRFARHRPSAFQAGHIPSWRGSCESYALSPVAGGSGWLLLLLSPLLSSVRHVRAWPPSPPGRGHCAPPPPPIGLTTVVLFAGGEVSSADSRVRSPGTLTCARCPAVRSALDAGPEAYDNPVAAWWGFFAASGVIRALAAGAGRETRSGHRIQDGKPKVHDSNPDLAPTRTVSLGICAVRGTSSRG